MSDQDSTSDAPDGLAVPDVREFSPGPQLPAPDPRAPQDVAAEAAAEHEKRSAAAKKAAETRAANQAAIDAGTVHDPEDVTPLNGDDAEKDDNGA